MERVVGVTVAADSLTKTRAAGWNAGGASAPRIEFGDGSVEFSATETNTRRATGLSRGDENQDVADVDYALLPEADGTLAVLESGVSRGTFDSCTTGDRLRVEVNEGAVRYLVNGASSRRTPTTTSAGSWERRPRTRRPRHLNLR